MLQSRQNFSSVSFALLVLYLFCPAIAHACGPQVRVTFTEASPDRIRIEFLRGKGLQISSLRLDFKPSAGNAYVDWLYPQNHQNPSKTVIVDKITGFEDGSQAGTIEFKAFPAKQSFTLEIDLDDAAVGGDYDVSHLTDGELKGAIAIAILTDNKNTRRRLTGRFDAKGIATLGSPACV